MPQTAEEKESQEALRTAVDSAVQTAWPQDVPSILTDFVVIYARQMYDDDGDLDTTVGWIAADDGIPRYRLVGLSEYFRAAIMSEVAVDYGVTEEEDDE